jgi:hypothetical protein
MGRRTTPTLTDSSAGCLLDGSSLATMIYRSAEGLTPANATARGRADAANAVAGRGVRWRHNPGPELLQTGRVGGSCSKSCRSSGGRGAADTERIKGAVNAGQHPASLMPTPWCRRLGKGNQQDRAGGIGLPQPLFNSRPPWLGYFSPDGKQSPSSSSQRQRRRAVPRSRSSPWRARTVASLHLRFRATLVAEVR